MDLKNLALILFATKLYLRREIVADSATLASKQRSLSVKNLATKRISARMLSVTESSFKGFFFVFKIIFLIEVLAHFFSDRITFAIESSHRY